jgi:hypothetical protein
MVRTYYGKVKAVVVVQLGNGENGSHLVRFETLRARARVVDCTMRGLMSTPTSRATCGASDNR